MSLLLTREVVEFVLQGVASAQTLDAVLALVDRAGSGFSAAVGEILADHLSAAIDDGRREAAIHRLAACDAPLARFVAARLLIDDGRSDAAVESLGRVLHGLPKPDPYVLLRRGRTLTALGRVAEAACDLQQALSLFPPYAFFLKCERLLDKIVTSGAWQARRTVRAALLSSSTTALLAPVLRAAAFRCGVRLETYEGLYGNYQQEILNPESGLHRFRPEFVFLALNHRDLALPPSGGAAMARQRCDELRALWEALRRRMSCHIVQVGFDLPPAGAWHALEDALPEGRRRAIAAVNLALAENLPAGVSFVDINAVAAHAGLPLHSAPDWHSSKQHPAPALLPWLADYLFSHCAAVLGMAAKVLVTDLDNTLWGGVIGEDLLGGIRIGPPTAEGEGFLELQRYMKELQQRGVLLAVCSKNNPADAEMPFERHDAMLLRRGDFAAFLANWDDKAANLERLARELSLGLDSFVFLDDNPLERALVRERLPQVIVPECDAGPSAILAALHRGLYFPTIALTAEDLARHGSYQANAERREFEQSEASLDGFLAGLEMTAAHGPVDAATLPRVAQLVNKTNQFNLTARRYTEEQIQAAGKTNGWWQRWFRLADRFGDHGLIGVLLVEKGRLRWRIDVWLMSCRILGRQMEEFMFFALQAAARDEGAQELLGEYLPTAKNQLVEGLYARLGFRELPDCPGQWLFDLREQPLAAPRFIRDQSHG